VIEMIASGTYRHRITIQNRVVTQNPLGEIEPDWQDVVAGASALVEDINGRERVAAQDVHALVNTRIRMRYRSGISARMQVIFRQQIYNIEAVIRNDAVNVEMLLLCSTGLVSDGLVP
jgi:SPP1 family predicted phage head-tail adaptor